MLQSSKITTRARGLISAGTLALSSLVVPQQKAEAQGQSAPTISLQAENQTKEVFQKGDKERILNFNLLACTQQNLICAARGFIKDRDVSLIACLDRKTLKRKWQAQLSSAEINGSEQHLGAVTDGKFVYIGSTCLIPEGFKRHYVLRKIDASTGDIINSKRLNFDDGTAKLDVNLKPLSNVNEYNMALSLSAKGLTAITPTFIVNLNPESLEPSATLFKFPKLADPFGKGIIVGNRYIVTDYDKSTNSSSVETIEIPAGKKTKIPATIKGVIQGDGTFPIKNSDHVVFIVSPKLSQYGQEKHELKAIEFSLAEAKIKNEVSVFVAEDKTLDFLPNNGFRPWVALSRINTDATLIPFDIQTGKVFDSIHIGEQFKDFIPVTQDSFLVAALEEGELSNIVLSYYKLDSGRVAKQSEIKVKTDFPYAYELHISRDGKDIFVMAGQHHFEECQIFKISASASSK